MGIRIYIIILIGIFSSYVWSDMPLTSTPFYKAYMDNEVVKYAACRKTLDFFIGDFLHFGRAPVDVKLAVINALGWRFEGAYNSRLYLYYLSLRYGKLIEEVDLINISKEDLFLYSYMLSLDNYDSIPERVLKYMEASWRGLRREQAAGIVYGLVKASFAFYHNNYCKVWKEYKVFLDRKYEKPMRKEAIDIINRYMILYREMCK